MTRLPASITLVALLVCSPIAARADVVLDWNAIALSTLDIQGASPFAHARFMSITQLAVTFFLMPALYAAIERRKERMALRRAGAAEAVTA